MVNVGWHTSGPAGNLYIPAHLRHADIGPVGNNPINGRRSMAYLAHPGIFHRYNSGLVHRENGFYG